ncbi:MAG: hypothetical protein HKO55_06445 [Gammaproteobacteria bacterium]|nr:hypothetical protein [Gammaproteobacteria bacterium]
MLRLFPCLLLVVLFAGCADDKAGPDPSAETPAADLPLDLASSSAGDPVAGDEPAIPEEFRLTSFKWDGPMNAGDSLRVRNPYGDIRCRKSGTGELIVSAQIQTFTDWQPAPEIAVVDNNGRFELKIDHQHPVRAEFGGDYQQGFAGRIDVTVLLPPQTTADLETIDGALRVKNFIGALNAKTTSGELYYKSTGSFDLATRDGAVDVTVSEYTGASEIRTESGPVSVILGAGVSATLGLESAGKIDFRPAEGVAAGRQRVSDQKQIVLGDGDIPLNIRSSSGDITINVD